MPSRQRSRAGPHVHVTAVGHVLAGGEPAIEQVSVGAIDRLLELAHELLHRQVIALDAERRAIVDVHRVTIDACRRAVEAVIEAVIEGRRSWRWRRDTDRRTA